MLFSRKVLQRILGVLWLIDGLIGIVQVLLGISFLVLPDRWVKPVVIVSMVWALIVWYGGEGMSMLLTGQASIFTGAPGAVLLYPLLGLAIWPRSPSSGETKAQGGFMKQFVDHQAIRQAALDYIEGWHTGDAERMEGSLHPDLAKRLVMRGASPYGGDQLSQTSALGLVQKTRQVKELESPLAFPRPRCVFQAYLTPKSLQGIRIILASWDCPTA
jgi:hypothetical protein